MSKKILIMFFAIMFLLFGCESEEDLAVQTEIKENIPTKMYMVILKTISEKITDDEDLPIYEISCTYPIIISGKNDDITKKVNLELEANARKFITDSKEGEIAKDAKTMAKKIKLENKEFYPHSSKVNYILKYNDNNMISFLIAREDYIGGTMPVCTSVGKTYNMQSGKVMNIEEVLEPTDLGLIEIIYSGLKNAIQESSELAKISPQLSEEAIEKNIEKLNWCISENGLEFFFNPKTVIPNLEEILQFTYAYNGNKNMFKIEL